MYLLFTFMNVLNKLSSLKTSLMIIILYIFYINNDISINSIDIILFYIFILLYTCPIGPLIRDMVPLGGGDFRNNFYINQNYPPYGGTISLVTCIQIKNTPSGELVF